MEARHRIRKFIIEADVNDLQRSHAQREWIKRLTLEKVMPRLEKRLSELAPADTVLRLPRLEIDLGLLHPEMEEVEIVRRIEEVIGQLVLSSSPALAAAIEERSLSSHRTEAILYYLIHGVLPWWAGKADAQFSQLLSSFVASNASYIWTQLQKQPQAEVAILRLMQQIQAEERDAFIQRAAPNAGVWIEVMKLVSLLERETGAAHIRLPELKVHTTAFLLSLVMESKEAQKPAFVAACLAEVLGRFFSTAKTNQLKWAVYTALRLQPDQEISQGSHHHLSSRALEEQAANALSPLSEEMHAANASTRFPKLEAAEMKQAIQEKLKEWKPQAQKKFQPLPGSEVEEIYVANAGLVLLHPFLPALFAQVGFTQDDAWVSEEAAAQAAGYLQFIATGNLEMNEPDLALNKILCGLPVSHPLPAAFEFTELQLSEGEEVLRSLIANWPVLGDPEPDGLRGSFLLRDGRLTAQGSNWKLKVNRHAFDMVLDQLPFGLGVIHHPWMEGMVFVEW